MSEAEKRSQWPDINTLEVPVDPAARERAVADFRAGRCEDMADVLARVEAGGPLVPDEPHVAEG